MKKIELTRWIFTKDKLRDIIRYMHWAEEGKELAFMFGDENPKFKKIRITIEKIK